MTGVPDLGLHLLSQFSPLFSFKAVGRQEGELAPIVFDVLHKNMINSFGVVEQANCGLPGHVFP